MGCCLSSGWEPYSKLKPLLTVGDVVHRQQELIGKPVKLVGRAVPGPDVLESPFGPRGRRTRGLVIKTYMTTSYGYPEYAVGGDVYCPGITYEQALCAIGAVQGFHLQQDEVKIWVDLAGCSRASWRLEGPIGGKKEAGLKNAYFSPYANTGNLMYAKGGHPDLGNGGTPCLVTSKSNIVGQIEQMIPIEGGLEWWEAFSGDRCNEYGRAVAPNGAQSQGMHDRPNPNVKKGWDKGCYRLDALNEWKSGMKGADFHVQDVRGHGLTEYALKPGDITVVCGVLRRTDDGTLTLVPELPRGGGDMTNCPEVAPELKGVSEQIRAVSLDESQWDVKPMTAGRWFREDAYEAVELTSK